ncbi:MAG: hypothetical protein JSR66_20830 [Proteobacteria bacterium]|nr:hypothetical protein [Pseudomonadota bacterium]
MSSATIREFCNNNRFYSNLKIARPPVFTMAHALVNRKDLKPGDVLYGFDSSTRSHGGALASGYSHAGIFIGRNRILEATPPTVRKIDFQGFAAGFSHIAVFRCIEPWPPERIDALKSFARKAIGKPFNEIGLRRCELRRETTPATAMERYLAYRDGRYVVRSERGVYFCSELVAAAFVSSGMISLGAATQLLPEAFAPIDLTRDKVFGFFLGFAVPYRGYKIPKDDVFIDSVLPRRRGKSSVRADRIEGRG